MKTLTVKVPDKLHAKLEAVAAQRRESKSAVVRAAIAGVLEATTTSYSCLDLARDLRGCAEGPADLSYDKKHLRGYGR